MADYISRCCTGTARQVNINFTPRESEQINYPNGIIRKAWFLFFNNLPQSKSAAIADIATADATDLPTAIALANANKAKINELLTAFRKAGIINQ